MKKGLTFHDVKALILLLGIAGTVLGNLIGDTLLGAGLGVLTALFLGISHRHKHHWNRAVVYDAEDKPHIMLKVCDCGETQFDGFFAKEKTK